MIVLYACISESGFVQYSRWLSNLFCRYFASAPKRLKFGDDDAPQTPPAADIDSTIGFPKQPNTHEPPASNAWVDPQRYVNTDHSMHMSGYQ